MRASFFGKRLLFSNITIFFCFSFLAFFNSIWAAEHVISNKLKKPITPTPSADHEEVIIDRSGGVNALPDSYMRPRKFKINGVSSEGAPEEYDHEVMFEIPSKELMDKYKFGWNENPILRVDDKENVYLTFQTAVVVFEKSGKILRTIQKDAAQNGLLVDELGNMCIYNSNFPNDFWIYDPAGNLISKSKFPHLRWNQRIRFSNGVIFTEKNVLFKVKGADENKVDKKINFSHLKYKLTDSRTDKQYESDINSNLLPGHIDSFGFERILDEDRNGDIYALYQQYSYAGEHPSWVLDRLYKFDYKFRLLAKFDFFPNDINLKTGSLYQIEGSPYGRVVKWKKHLRPE
jgi:hypothetical protein